MTFNGIMTGISNLMILWISLWDYTSYWNLVEIKKIIAIQGSKLQLMGMEYDDIGILQNQGSNGKGECNREDTIRLVVSTPLKNICQLELVFPIYGKIKNVPNQRPAIYDIWVCLKQWRQWEQASNWEVAYENRRALCCIWWPYPSAENHLPNQINFGFHWVPLKFRAVWCSSHRSMMEGTMLTHRLLMTVVTRSRQKIGARSAEAAMQQ